MKLENETGILEKFLDDWDFSETYLIYGTSTTANHLLEKLDGKLKIAGFLDSNEHMWGEIFQNLPVFSREEWKKKYWGTKIIVASGAYTEIRDFLTQEGLKEQKDFCDSRFLLGSYFAVTQNQVHLYRTDICITECCNLRCKKCNMMMPYYQAPKHRELEFLKSDIDNYFQWVDYVQLFNILGGEPFIYPHVEELTQYICEKYRSRIGQLEFFTNGIPRISDSLFEMIQTFRIGIQVSDYRNGIPFIAERVDAFLSRLKEKGIPYRRNIDNQWLDFGFPDYVNEYMSESELTNFFDRCYSPFRGLHNKKLYYCHLNTSAVCAGLFQEDRNDYFDLNHYDPAKKKALVLFDLGYTKKGYITFCKKCKGCFAVNEEYTHVAAQMDRKGR